MRPRLLRAIWAAHWCRNRRSGLFVSLFQVVIRCAHFGAHAALEGRGLSVVLRGDTAIVAHLDQLGVVGMGEHGVLAGELVDDALDGAFDPEKCATFDAGEGFFFVEDLGREGVLGEVHLWGEGDCILRADGDAEAALQAGVFLEAQLGAVGVVCERAGGAEAGAAEAKGAGVGVDENGAVGCAFGQWKCFFVWCQGFGGHAGDFAATA